MESFRKYVADRDKLNENFVDLPTLADRMEELGKQPERLRAKLQQILNRINSEKQS